MAPPSAPQGAKRKADKSGPAPRLGKVPSGKSAASTDARQLSSKAPQGSRQGGGSSKRTAVGETFSLDAGADKNKVMTLAQVCEKIFTVNYSPGRELRGVLTLGSVQKRFGHDGM